MDFYGMKRKQLQSLCKKHGIPANLANAEMADRLTSLLKEDEKSMSEVEPVYKNLEEIESEIDSKVESQKVKKVRFSPENETFYFVGTDKDSDSDCDYVAKNKQVAKRKSIVNRVSKKKQVQVIENAWEVELSTEIMDNPVRFTRSRAQKMAEGDAEAVFLPLPEKKKVRGGAKYIDVHDKPPPEFELSERVGGNVECAKLSGGLIRRQLRSRVVESEDGGDSLVLRKNVLPRGLKKTKDNKGSDGLLFPNEICEDSITAGKGAKPEKIQKLCKGNVTKAEDSSVLTEKLGKIDLCGRITRSRTRIEKKSSGVEREIGINKDQEECEEVLQLEETFKGLDRKSLRQKSAAPLKRNVDGQNLAGEGVEPGKTLRKSKRNLARDRDSECGQLAETKVVRRSKKSETKIVGKACTTSYVGQEECEEVPQFEEPSKGLTINTSRQKYPVLQKGKEHAKVDTRKRPRNTDLERASKLELSVEILEENEVLLPNGPLRRSRRQTTLFTSAGPDDSKLTTSEAAGTVKQSTESVAEKGSNVTKCLRRSSRNSCKKILTEANDDMGGIANGVKKGGIRKQIQESTLENEHGPLNKKPPRQSSRTASKSDLVAPTGLIGIASGMNKKRESRMPIIADEVLFTKINSLLEEEPNIDVGLVVLEAAGNDNGIDSCCSREVVEKSSKKRKGSSKKTEPATKGQPVHFALSAVYSNMEKAMDVSVHLKENQLTESVKFQGISTVQKAQNVTEPVINLMKSVMVDDGILDNTSVGHMDDHSSQSLNRGDTGHDHVVEQNREESPDKLSNVASSRFTCLGDDHSPTYQPDYEGESFNLLVIDEGLETEASLPVKTTNQRTDMVDDQLADGSKGSVLENQNLVQLGASGINQPVIVKQNPEESPDKLSNAYSSRFSSLGDDHLPTYQADCEGESSNLLSLNEGLETEASLPVKTTNQRTDVVDDQLADGSKTSVPEDQNLVQLDASGINQTAPVEPVLKGHLTELNDNKDSDRNTEKSYEVIEEISALMVRVDVGSIKTAETVGEIHQCRIVPSDTAVTPSKSSFVKQEGDQLKDQSKSPASRNLYEGYEDGSKNQNLSFDDVDVLDENAVAASVKTCSIESSMDAVAEKIESWSQKKSPGASNMVVSLDSEVQERAPNEVIQSALQLDQVKYGDPDIHEKFAIEMNRHTDMVGNANTDDIVGTLDTNINSKNVCLKAEIEDNVVAMTEINLDNIGDCLDHASEGNRVSQSEAGLASRDGEVDTKSIRDDFTEKLSAVNSFAKPQMYSGGAIVDAEQDVAGKLDGPVEGNLKNKHSENAMDVAVNTKIFEQCDQQFSEKKLSVHEHNAELAEERIVEDNQSFNEQDDASSLFQGYINCEKDAYFWVKNSKVSTHEAMRTEAATIGDSDFTVLGDTAAENMIISGVEDNCRNTGVAEDKEACAMISDCMEMQQPENIESLLPFGLVGPKWRDLPMQEGVHIGKVETVSGMKVDHASAIIQEYLDCEKDRDGCFGVKNSYVSTHKAMLTRAARIGDSDFAGLGDIAAEDMIFSGVEDMCGNTGVAEDKEAHATFGGCMEMQQPENRESLLPFGSVGLKRRDLPMQEGEQFGTAETVSGMKVDEGLNAGKDGFGIDLGGYPEMRDLPSQEGNEIGVAERVPSVKVDEENKALELDVALPVFISFEMKGLFRDDKRDGVRKSDPVMPKANSMSGDSKDVKKADESDVIAQVAAGKCSDHDHKMEEVVELKSTNEMIIHSPVGSPVTNFSSCGDGKRAGFEKLDAGLIKASLMNEDSEDVKEGIENATSREYAEELFDVQKDNRALDDGSEIFTQEEMNMILGDAEQDVPENLAGSVEGNLKNKCSDNAMDDGDNIKTFELCDQQFSEKQFGEHENGAEFMKEPILEANERYNEQNDVSAIIQEYKDCEKDRDEYFGVKNSNVSTQKAMLTEAARIGDFGYTGLGDTTAENMNISGVEDKCPNTGVAEDKEANAMTDDRMVMQQAENGDSFLEGMGEFRKSVAALGACTEVANGRSNAVSETLLQLDEVNFGGLGKCHEIFSTLDKCAPGASVFGSMEAVIGIENVDDGTKLVGKKLLGLDGGSLWEERNSSDIKLVSDISCSRPDLGPSDLNVPLSCNDPERRDLTIQKGDKYGKGERVSPMKVDEGLNSGTDGFGGDPEKRDFPMQEVKEFGVLESVSGMKVDEGLNAGIDDCDEENHTKTSKGTEEVHDMHNPNDMAICSGDFKELTAFGNLHPNSMIKPEMRVDSSADSPVTASCHSECLENKASELSVASPLFNSFEIKLFRDDKRDVVRKSDPEMSKANSVSGDTEDVKIANESDVTPQLAAGQLSDHEHKMEEIMELNSNQEMGNHCHVGSPVSNFSSCGDGKRDGFKKLDAGLIKASVMNEDSEDVKEGRENALGNGPVFAEQHCNHGQGNADEDIDESGDVECSGVCTRTGKLIADAEMSGSNSSASDVLAAESKSNHAKQAGNNVNPDAEYMKFSVDSDIVSEVNARVDQCSTSANSVFRKINLESPRNTSWEVNLDKGISVSATSRWKNRNSLISGPPKSLVNTFDMKENFGSTKSDQVNITAVKTLQNRRALEDLQNK